MTSEYFNLSSLLQVNIAEFSSNEVSHKVFQKLSMKIHPPRKKKSECVNLSLEFWNISHFFAWIKKVERNYKCWCNTNRKLNLSSYYLPFNKDNVTTK